MAFCSNCGSQVQGQFCPNCGTAVGAGAGAATGNPNAGTYVPPTTVSTGGLEPHIAGALCYTPFVIGLIISIIFVVMPPYNQNKFVRFCAFQSLFLHLAFFVLGIAVSIVFGIITAMIHAFALVFIPIWPLVWVGTLVLLLYMMYKAFNNQKVLLPYIGELAEKQA